MKNLTLYNSTSQHWFKLVFVSLMLFLVSACNDSDNPMSAPLVPTKIFRVDATNLTANQPMSPLAVALHSSGDFWQIGQPASNEIEILAEGGDNSAMLAMAMVESSASGGGILMPGGTESLFITSTNFGGLNISVATMLVNTNDAFSGINKVAVDGMQVGDRLSFRAIALDAGTEFNSEAQGSIPGPADGGEGYNSLRDDRDFIAQHSGVVTSHDGLMTSVLDESHRFDNPVVLIKVTRVQ